MVLSVNKAYVSILLVISLHGCVVNVDTGESDGGKGIEDTTTISESYTEIGNSPNDEATDKKSDSKGELAETSAMDTGMLSIFDPPEQGTDNGEILTTDSSKLVDADSDTIVNSSDYVHESDTEDANTYTEDIFTDTEEINTGGANTRETDTNEKETEVSTDTSKIKDDTEQIPVCAGCFIEGICLADGATNPYNPCLECDVETSEGSWSGISDKACDDGLFCTVNDTCLSGTCSGEPRSCDDGVACNGVETCDEENQTCIEGTALCDDMQVCNVALDTCTSTCDGCTIDGVCYEDGKGSTVNPCVVCNTDLSETTWSVDKGKTCDDSNLCTYDDVCNDSGECIGTTISCESSNTTCGAKSECAGTKECKITYPDSTVSCDDGNGCTVEDVCNGKGECKGIAMTCSDDIDCTVDSCVDGVCVHKVDSSHCLIANQCFNHQQDNPQNQCQFCDATNEQYDWSNYPTTQSCDDGLWCTGNDFCDNGQCEHTNPLHDGCTASAVIHFDGIDDEVDLGATVGTDVRTIEFWFRLDAPISTSSTFTALLRREGNASGNAGEFGIHFIDSQFDTAGRITFSISDVSAGVRTDANSWPADQWFHLAAVVHPTMGMMMFVNGKKQAETNANTTAPVARSESIYLGSWGHMGRYFHGSIDDLRMSTEALYAEDFEPQCLGTEPRAGDIGLWRFEGNDPSLAEDSSGNSNHGAIKGATVVQDVICATEYNQNLISGAHFVDSSGFNDPITNLWDHSVETWATDMDSDPAWIEFGFDEQLITYAMMFDDNTSNQVTSWRLLKWTGADWVEIFGWVPTATKGWHLQQFYTSTSRVRFEFKNDDTISPWPSIQELKLIAPKTTITP